MNQAEKDIILEKAQKWFKNSIAKNHITNTEKLKNASEFDINPFLAVYLSNFLTGKAKPEGIAKALVYPRALGTSITTSFGTNIQRFTNDVLSSFGSTTSGIDIEFIDQINKNKIYCQLKSGPNTINKDDVETIAGHFTKVINLGRTNNLRITHNDMVVGIIYGDRASLNGHYKRIINDYHYPIYIGQDFWHRLTGDENFYTDLIHAIGEVAAEADYNEELEEVISELANTPDVRKLSK
ncbi:PmeII family type II restriction endonuclease [Kangiella geojedonensis]|uniref:MjaII restriction endonuclease n=1 Tax=Kangiella geojedonensis TaxID=914150 RepID=A0A0F6TPW0_9GAMM|nr:PmeII family type II restriction endonuclease [Kangiella geojedonensis]AKE51730.1 MjaII restriction endonuclease [Kangiella geojedonensis]